MGVGVISERLSGGSPCLEYVDEGGVVFEVDSVAEAQRYVNDFPLTKKGFLEWTYLPVTAPLPIEALMDPSVDVAEPYDRTK